MRRILACVVAAALLLGGCDYSDPDRMAVITGAAIDAVGDNYELSIEVVKTKSASLDEPVEVEVFAATAPSLDACEQQLKRVVGAALYWGHTQTLILSESAAKSKLRPLIDWVLRAGELRLTVVMGVSGEQDAKTLLMAEQSGSYSVGSALAGAVRDSGFATRGVGSSAHRTVESVLSTGAAMLPEFRLADQGDRRGYAVVCGGALVGEDGFAGFVDDRTARDLLLIHGAAEDYELIRTPDGKYGLTLEDVSVDKAVTPGERPSVRLLLRGSCKINYYDSTAPTPDADKLDELARAASAVLCERLEYAVAQSRAMGVDAAGIAAVLEEYMSEDEAKAAANCGVSVDAELTLENVGLVARSPIG